MGVVVDGFAGRELGALVHCLSQKREVVYLTGAGASCSGPSAWTAGFAVNATPAPRSRPALAMPLMKSVLAQVIDGEYIRAVI